MDCASFKTYIFIITYFWKQHNLARKGCFTQVSTAIKLTINRIPPFGTLEDLPVKYSNSDENWTLTTQDD